MYALVNRMLTRLLLNVLLRRVLLSGILIFGLTGIGLGLPATGMDKPDMSLPDTGIGVSTLGAGLPDTEECVSLDGESRNEQEMALQLEPQSLIANRTNEEPGHIQRLVTRAEYLDSHNFVKAVHHATGDIYLFHTTEHDFYRLSPDGALKHITTISEASSGAELSDNSESLPNWLVMDITPNGSDVYLWYHGLGPLYRYSIVDDIVAPIFDRNIDKILYGHSYTIDFEGNLYVAGGDGLWQFHNLILTANRQSDDWQNIASLNNNVVPNGFGGNTYTNQQTIYYLVRNVDTPGDIKPLGMYRLNRAEKVWTPLPDITERFSLVEDLDRIVVHNFPMSTTSYHHKDEGVIYVPYWLEDKLNLLEWNIETGDMLIYHLDTLGLSERSSLFRPGFSTYWTGVSLSSSDSLSTDITMVSFDLENWPSVTVVPQKQSDGLSPYLVLLPVMFLLGATYVIRQKRNKLGQHSTPKIPVITSADSPIAPVEPPYSVEQIGPAEPVESRDPVEPRDHADPVDPVVPARIHLSRSGDEIILRQNDVRIPLTQTLETRFWGLIYDSLLRGTTSISFEEIDHTIMPYEHQKATKSRTRKKLLELASEFAGNDAFRVKRSKKDRRKKVLMIDPSKFTLS